MNIDGVISASNVLRWAGALGIASIAIMRALTAFAPQVYFDLDPAIDPSPLAALSPAGTLWLDALLLLACAFAMLGEALSGRTIDWKLLILAAIPAPIVFWHASHDLGDLWRGTTWLAGAFALVAVAHLARDRTLRIVLLCAVFALVGPLLVRGLSQVTIEHAATVAQFEQHKEHFLLDRGWEPGSPSAQIYERRLRQAQPVGWFATTNIYGSIMAAAFVLLLGLTIAAWRTHELRKLTIISIAIASVALIALYFTGSKGALLAALIGAAALLLPTIRLVVPHPQRLAPYLVVALIPLTLAGIIIRGAVLPEDFLGDRSLLFRWHYLVSSFDIVRHAPLLGVGPDGFQQAYTMFRLPRNPEEVISAHSVFVDWCATLGVAAVAWIVLVMSALWRAGRAATITLQERAVDFDIPRAARTFAAGVAVLGIFPAILVEQHVLEGVHFILRVLGIVAFLGVAAAIAHLAHRAERAVVAMAAAVAAAVLLMHGQIEMTFFQPGSVVWAMCVIGIAAGSGAGTRGVGNSGVATRRWESIAFIAAPLCAIALWIAITGAYPATVQSHRTAQAAQLLYPPGEHAPQRIGQRRAASAMLLQAYEAMPTNVLPLHAAIRQLDLAAAEERDPQRRAQLLSDALALADRAVDSHRHIASYGIRAGLLVRLAFATGDQAHFGHAIDDLERVADADSHGILPWQRLGDVQWLAGRRAEAANAYERALVNDANFVLDPLKRLPEQERERVKRRVDEAQSAAR